MTTHPDLPDRSDVLPAGRTRSCLAAATAAAGLAWWGDPSCLQLAGYVPILVTGWLTHDANTPAVGEIFTQWEVWRSALTVAGAGMLLRHAWCRWPVQPPFGNLTGTTLRRLLNGSVWVAVTCPAVYAVTRLAWAVGVPLGLGPEFLEQIRPIVGKGAVLAAGAVAGAALTVGLTRRWSERFPAWVPGLGGRPVPVGLARNSALVVALMVGSAGCYFVRTIAGGKPIDIAPAGAAEHWGAWLPEMLWPVWAVALAMAALAYAERRRRGGLGSVA